MLKQIFTSPIAGLIYAVSILMSLVLHELGHAVVSTKLGDPTPKREGRLTLNPLKHLDLVGTIFMVVAGFGWARPVQINPEYYKNKKMGTVLVSLAGPCTNLLLGLIGTIFLYILPATAGFFSTFVLVNVSLGVFNLLPIPPLDGSKILSLFLPEETYFRYISLGERYGFFLLAILLLFNSFAPILNVLVSLVFRIYDFLLFFL